jgi:hypothetical protein
MSSVKIIILCESTFTEFSEEKLQILEANNIPYLKSGDRLYFIDDYEKEIDTREIGKHDFLFSLFSGIPNYYLGDFKLPDKSKLKILVEVFEIIDLYLRVIDSHSGENDRLYFKLSNDLKIKYKFER